MEIYNYKLVKYTFKLFYAKILFLFEYPRLFLKLFFYPIYVFRIFSFFFFFCFVSCIYPINVVARNFFLVILRIPFSKI
jgi:hypothetical protein